MSEILKPDNLSTIWAESGDKIKPEDSKILQGWVVEVPTNQAFNYVDHRQDKALAHINQHGIPVWDAMTRYIAKKSFVQGSNGVIYRCLIDNFGQDPTLLGSYWEEAFATVDGEQALSRFVGYSAQSTSFAAVANTRYYVLAPLVVTLPSTAVVGQTVTLVKKPNLSPTVVVEGGGKIFTGIGQADSIIFDIEDEVNFVFNGSAWEV